MTVQPLGRRRPGLGLVRARVDEIISDRRVAICVDAVGVRYEVPLNVRRAKGGWPQVGETWLLSREFGTYWVFAALMDDQFEPIVIQTPRAGADPLAVELLDALIKVGIVQEPRPLEGPHGD